MSARVFRISARASGTAAVVCGRAKRQVAAWEGSGTEGVQSVGVKRNTAALDGMKRTIVPEGAVDHSWRDLGPGGGVCSISVVSAENI
ncbi:hypothetical protein GCM10009680_11860 [Streptomyces yatensis]|uniref:Uncharacterized protein n=1 Tax=Streptomyces yatensis TaxID=155177 RepID=A0ABP4SJG5_9ACTN